MSDPHEPQSWHPTQAQCRDFSRDLVAWQLRHGRHDLPWQQDKNPYRVWLSEIMLQQTQVTTVKSYFENFVGSLPTVHDLANAPHEHVMALWAGLGYYSRARNLHRCAKQVVSDWGGEFPRTAAELQTLSGIGPSTAAAIASVCFEQRVAILDGNVKRVLARWLGYERDVGDARSVRELRAVAQQLAEAVQDSRQMPTFTQALMDLGATLCRPKQPECTRCPVRSTCRAEQQQRQTVLPIKRGRVTRKTERWWLVFAQNQGGEWGWVQRPMSGIWSGLVAPLVFDAEASAQDWVQRFGADHQVWPMVKHVLTHRDLYLYPIFVNIKPGWHKAAGFGFWESASESSALGMPAPVRKLWHEMRGD